jgi:hypothetical protein
MKGIFLSAPNKALLLSDLIRGSASSGDAVLSTTPQGLEGGSQWQNNGAIVNEPPTSASSVDTAAFFDLISSSLNFGISTIRSRSSFVVFLGAPLRGLDFWPTRSCSLLQVETMVESGMVECLAWIFL